jgi:imidazolonepropionase-like amidohydrolase
MMASMRPNRLPALFLTSLLAVFSIAAAPAQTTFVRFGTLIAQKGQVLHDAIVVIDGDRIKQVGSAEIAIPAGANVVDLRRYTGIPGLIDVHTHMTYYWDRAPGTTPWSRLGSFSPAVRVFLAQESARKTLETGVTTVRDLGSSDYTDIAMRDLINRGAMLGPRMFVAGYGLHISSRPDRPGYSSPDLGRADGVAEVERVARQQLGAGADWVKMYGSTGSDQDVSGFETFSFEEMKAAADVAHRAGKRIAIHSYGPDGARDAVRAGADSVEHAIDIDDETFRAMLKQGTVYVPTVAHNQYYINHRAEYGYNQAVVDGLTGFIAKNEATLRRAIQMHVKVAMGSDAVFTGFGENTDELPRLVKCGMTPAEALDAATRVGAELLDKGNDLGRIAPGAFADIVAVEGDPLADIDVVVHHIRLVMKGGRIVVDKR